jgi:hypothetical protein
MRLRRLLDVPGLAVDDVRCDGGLRDWSEGESCVDFALVLVRSGCFRRRVDGRASPLDPAVLYVQAPGEEQQFAHPHTGGDACRLIRVARELPVALDPLSSPPSVDLEHLLLASLHHVNRSFRAQTGETLSRYRNRVPPRTRPSG